VSVRKPVNRRAISISNFTCEGNGFLAVFSAVPAPKLKRGIRIRKAGTGFGE
jgi:hypothetical protein